MKKTYVRPITEVISILDYSQPLMASVDGNGNLPGGGAGGGIVGGAKSSRFAYDEEVGTGWGNSAWTTTSWNND